MVLEKTLENLLDSKEIKQVNPKGNQHWIFTGRTGTEAEAPILWPPGEPTHWKRPWCWGRLKAKGEGEQRRRWLGSITDYDEFEFEQTPRACSNSCPSSRWCHPTISSSVIPSSSHLQSFPASGSFPVSQFFVSGAEVLALQLQHQSFQWILRTNFL